MVSTHALSTTLIRYAACISNMPSLSAGLVFQLAAGLGCCLCWSLSLSLSLSLSSQPVWNAGSPSPLSVSSLRARLSHPDSQLVSRLATCLPVVLGFWVLPPSSFSCLQPSCLPSCRQAKTLWRRPSLPSDCTFRPSSLKQAKIKPVCLNVELSISSIGPPHGRFTLSPLRSGSMRSEVCNLLSFTSWLPIAVKRCACHWLDCLAAGRATAVSTSTIANLRLALKLSMQDVTLNGLTGKETVLRMHIPSCLVAFVAL